MWLLHCLLIIIHGKDECFLSPFLITVISMYTSLWKSTEKCLSYTVCTSQTGVRCSCYMWKITITLIKTSKCKNTHTHTWPVWFSNWASLIFPLVELHYLTITPQNSIEKDFAFFVSFTLSRTTHAFKMEIGIKARYSFHAENLGFSFSFVI